MLRLFRSRPAPIPQPSFVEVAHAGQSYRVAVKRVGRARRFTLRVRAATLDAVLTMPAGGSLRAARSFVERNAEWIGDRIDRLPQKIPFLAGSTIPFRGVDVSIVHCRGLRAAAWLDTVMGPDGTTKTVIHVTGNPDQQRRRILDFLRREARRDLDEAVRRHTRAIGRGMAPISLRDTRSRWGSCTARGALNFSWRLIMAPPHVLDYLAAHEVAHLIHMNHSPAYWGVARRLAPDLEFAEAWLRQYGPGLHKYG